LADNGFEVNIWCHDPYVAESVAKRRCNELYLPDTKLSKHIRPFTDLAGALEKVTWVFEATPVPFLRSVLQNVEPYFLEDQVWVMLSKGIENKTLFFPSQIIDSVFNKNVKKAVLSGPSFAKEIVLKKLTAVNIASEDKSIAEELKKMLENNYFKTKIISDILGAQIGGALKNIIAIAVGILDGAGYTDNTKSFLLTTGLSEMVAFAHILGAEKDTMYDLAGLGDLVLTCTGSLSRNLMVGRHLGLGEKLDDIVKKTGVVPEGVNTSKSVYEMIQKNEIHLPVFASVYGIIFGEKTVADLIGALHL